MRDLAAAALMAEAPKGQNVTGYVETLRYQGSDPDGTLEMFLTEGKSTFFPLFF